MFCTAVQKDAQLCCFHELAGLMLTRRKVQVLSEEERTRLKRQTKLLAKDLTRAQASRRQMQRARRLSSLRASASATTANRTTRTPAQLLVRFARL